jgi:hypothetical protein
METFSIRDLVVEVVNKLFIYTDLQEWEKLQREVFTPELFFDMSSIGGEKMQTTAAHICETWKNGFAGLDAVNHLAGNYLIEIIGDEASVFAYATATHYKESATHGKTREMVGSYNLHIIKNEGEWRIDQFGYNLKYATGNADLA